VLYGASSLGIFVINAFLRTFTDVPHLVEIAEWSVVWGTLAVAGVLISGRLAFGRWLRVSVAAFVVAATGIGLSATFNVVLQQWANARFGEFDAEYVEWSAALFAVLIGFATAAFGVFVAPRSAIAWPLGYVLFGFALIAVIIVLNVPGLADGIDPESWPLAIWLGLSGLYAALVTVASIQRARHLRATPER
jgi:hypothetical protein